MSNSDYEYPSDCPACSERLEGKMPNASDESHGEKIVVEFDCPECGERLQHTAESALPDALGVDVSLEVVSDD